MNERYFCSMCKAEITYLHWTAPTLGDYTLGSGEFTEDDDYDNAYYYCPECDAGVELGDIEGEREVR